MKHQSLLYQIIKERGLTLAQCIRDTKLSETTWYNVIKGKNVSTYTMRVITQYLNLTHEQQDEIFHLRER